MSTPDRPVSRPPSPYLDTTGSGRSRWLAKLRIGRLRSTVDLGVPGPGNQREAQRWATRIHLEVQAGALSDAAADQLGPRQAGRIRQAIVAARSHLGDSEPIASWEGARDAWLAATAAQDRVTAVPGKAVVVPRTRRDRISRLRVFLDWVDRRGFRFQRESSTRILTCYAEDRLRAGRSVETVKHDLRILRPWFVWLSRRGLYAAPDAEALAEILPPSDAADPWMPDWSLDVKVLATLHEHRFDSPYHTAAWSAFLLVRGTGCRPTEAISVCWSSIDLEADEVRWLDTKDARLKRQRHRHRRTPILLQWVHDGLAELKALRGGRRPHDPVCLSSRGRAWSSEAMSAKAFRRTMNTYGLPNRYKLKTAQKCQHRQLRWQGFPGDEIARWAGHSRTVHDSWYDSEGSTLVRPPVGLDYGPFAALTDYGQWVLDPRRRARL